MKKNLIFTIIGVVLIVVGIVVFVLPSKGNNSANGNNNGKDVEPEKISVDINDETVQELFSIFKLDGDRCRYIIIPWLNDSNQAKLAVAYDNLAEGEIKDIPCTNIKDYDGNACGEGAPIVNTEYVEVDVLKTKFYELFSSKFTFIAETFYSAAGRRMYFDNKQQIFAGFNEYMDGGCTNYSSQEITSAYKQGDNLYIETRAVTVTDQLDVVIKYEFVKENGRYVFSSVTEI